MPTIVLRHITLRRSHAAASRDPARSETSSGVHVAERQATYAYRADQADRDNIIDDLSRPFTQRRDAQHSRPVWLRQTTLLKVIAGLIKPDEGGSLRQQAHFRDTHGRARDRHGLQNYALYPHLGRATTSASTT